MMYAQWQLPWLSKGGGGVSLDQILGACFWKSHTTFTNFYLKDVAWRSKESSEYSLGSVVSAQHSTIIVGISYLCNYNAFFIFSMYLLYLALTCA